LLQPIGLAVVIAVFLLTQASMRLILLAPRLPGGFVLGYASSISPEQVVELTNMERSKAGLPPLSGNAQLSQAALAKANHMFANDYWAHVAPDGTTPWSFIKAAGYAYSVAGENLARDFNDTASMVQAWMNSETHKTNIVHQKYSQIGVAVVNGKLQGVETTLVVQLFGVPTGAVARTTTEAAISTAPAPAPEPVVLEVAALEPAAEPIAVEEPAVAVEQTPLPVMNQVTLGTRQPGVESSKFISPLSITKAIGTALIVLLVLVLSYDSIMISKKKLPRRVGNNWAHIGFFGVVLLIIVVMTQGKVL
jgi:hypothetical protein